MTITRRAMLTLAAASAAAAAMPALARERVRRVTYLGRPGDDGEWLRGALAERGYVEGDNVRLAVRPIQGEPAFAEAARVAVDEKPDVILAGGVKRIQKLMEFTTSIPIVCILGSDVVGAGLAQSLARPGKNVTGFSIEVADIAPITVALVRALRPTIERLLLIATPEQEPALREGLRPMVEAARAANLTWEAHGVGTLAALDRLFAAPGEDARSAAFLAGSIQRLDMARTVETLNARRIVTLGGLSEEWVNAGALMSFIRVITDKPRRVAAVVDKLLRGVDPGRIPFEVGEHTAFTLNLATARRIGVPIPHEILLRATRVVS